MSDQPDPSLGIQETDGKRSKKRKSKKKKARKGIADIDFGSGVTAAASADASKVAMEAEDSKEQHRDEQRENGSDRASDGDGSPASKRVVHTVETGDNGEVVEITQTTTIKREGGHGDHDDDAMKVDDLAEGESTVLVDVHDEGNVHTETTTELDSGPVTVENYEETLDDNTTVQVEHISQTLTTTKTIIITEDGQEVEVDANDPNVQYIEEEPEVITEEVTQTIRRRRIVTKTPDGREIETFEDVVVSDEDADDTTTTVIVTQDDVPEEGHSLPTCHVTIGASTTAEETPTPHINHDVVIKEVDEAKKGDDDHVTSPEVDEESVQMFVEDRVESGVSIEDVLGPQEDLLDDKEPSQHQLSFTHVEPDVNPSDDDDEPAVHVELPTPRDLAQEEDVACTHVKDGDDEERPRSESQRSAKFIIAAPPRSDGTVVRNTVKIYIRAEDPTPEDDEAPITATKATEVHARPSPAPCKDELIEKTAFGSREGMDEWVLVNFKHDEVLVFIELLKNLPFSYDVSTELPQGQCSCW